MGQSRGEAPRLNPVGAGLAVVGALAAVAALFLPAAEAPSGVAQVSANTLVQSDSGAGVAIRVIILAVIILALTYRYYRLGGGRWGIAIPAVLLVVGAFVDGRSDTLLTLYPLEPVETGDPVGDLSETTGGTRASAGIAFYLVGLGGILSLAGGALMFRSRAEMQAAEASGKVCPDCAEEVLAEARVCRFCGYRFAP